jgi:hypothetical protein
MVTFRAMVTARLMVPGRPPAQITAPVLPPVTEQRIAPVPALLTAQRTPPIPPPVTALGTAPVLVLVTAQRAPHVTAWQTTPPAVVRLLVAWCQGSERKLS